MALYPQLLFADTVSVTTQQALYNAYTSGLPVRSTFVKNVMLTNNGAGNVVLNLYVSKAASPDNMSVKTRVCPKDITIPPGNQLILDNEITLARKNFGSGASPDVRGDILSIIITTASPSVDIVVNGVEMD